MALRENWAEFRVSVIFVSNYKNSGGEKNSVIIEACYSLPCLAMSWGSCNHVTIKTAKDEALGCNHPFIWRISWKRNDVGVQMLNTFLISGVRDFAIGLPYPQSSTAPGEGVEVCYPCFKSWPLIYTKHTIFHTSTEFVIIGKGLAEKQSAIFRCSAKLWVYTMHHNSMWYTTSKLIPM